MMKKVSELLVGDVIKVSEIRCEVNSVEGLFPGWRVELYGRSTGWRITIRYPVDTYIEVEK